MNYGIEIALVALSVMVVGLIYYVLSRESILSSQIRGVAQSVEELHRELFMVDKRLKQEMEDIASLQESAARGDEPAERMILASLSHIEESFGTYRDKTEKRLHHLEERIRNLLVPASISPLDDEKVISLYNEGVEVDAIARELRLSKAEVEFVLKIHQLR